VRRNEKIQLKKRCNSWKNSLKGKGTIYINRETKRLDCSTSEDASIRHKKCQQTGERGWWTEIATVQLNANKWRVNHVEKCKKLSSKAKRVKREATIIVDEQTEQWDQPI